MPKTQKNNTIISYSFEYSIKNISSGKTTKSQNPQSILECSSTIKLAIVTIAIQKLRSGKGDISKRYKILPKYDSVKGSGVIHWRRFKRKYSINEMIKLIFLYSDCVATNFLIDFVGGKETVNRWLQVNGCNNTKLLVESIDFPAVVENDYGPDSVGLTSARDLYTLATIYNAEAEYKGIKNMIRKSSRRGFTYFALYAKYNNLEVKMLKTGSMLYFEEKDLKNSLLHLSGIVRRKSDNAEVVFGFTAELYANNSISKKQLYKTKDKMIKEMTEKIQNA